MQQRPRIVIKTYGCTHNRADSERMAGLLEAAGYAVAFGDSWRGADLFLVNSCAVKAPAEQKFRREIIEARKAGVPVVTAGCVVQGNPRDELLAGFSGVGVKRLDKVVGVVAATLRGETVREVAVTRENPGLSLPRLRRNRLITIIPVNSGCLSACTYCKTVHARGRLVSHPLHEVVEAVEAAVAGGAKEIWLTSEDVGAYGQDLGESLTTLLRAVSRLRGGFMVRVGMANPQHVAPQLNAILRLFKRYPDRFFRFLHVPVQSGSDAVLQAMGRGYDVALFERIVQRAKEAFPDITLMSDYIVGYPTESEEDFALSLSLAARTACRILNINRFYSRAGTRAARLQPLPTKLVAARTKRLVALYESQDCNKGLLGTEQEVLFTEEGKKESVVGHTGAYVQVVVPGLKEAERAALLGTRRVVRIIAENKYYLVGERPQESPL